MKLKKNFNCFPTQEASICQEKYSAESIKLKQSQKCNLSESVD